MLIKWGAGIVDARGSMGGMTVSRNRYGAYARARIAPVNPKSPLQSAIRAIVALVTTLWLESTTQDQRDAWAVFASNVPAKNKLGEVINLSGFNQFVKSNVVAMNINAPEILDAPVLFTLPGEDPDYTSEVDTGTELITITFDDTRPWAAEDNGFMVVQMGIPVSQGIDFFDGPWRHAGFLEGNQAIPITSPLSDVSVPFPVANGQKIYTRAKILRKDGRVSDWFRFNSIVATA